MRKFFSPDGSFITIVTKCGDMLIIGLLWILGSIPLITFGTSTAAAYYAAAKCVRRDTGYPAREFFRAYKRNLKQGILTSLWMLIILGILGLEFYWQYLEAYTPTAFQILGSRVVLILLLMLLCYVFPVMSRFEMKLPEVYRRAFNLSIRYWYFTLAILAAGAGLLALQIFVLNIAFILILPGLWMYLWTFPVEKALQPYMPQASESDEWYAVPEKKERKKNPK